MKLTQRMYHIQCGGSKGNIRDFFRMTFFVNHLKKKDNRLLRESHLIQDKIFHCSFNLHKMETSHLYLVRGDNAKKIYITYII